jgi:hypothetical protein
MDARSKPQLQAEQIDASCKKYNSIRIYRVATALPLGMPG